MPHLSVQASANITIKQPERLLRQLNNCLWQSGHFKQPQDIKARILAMESFLVGVEDDQQAHGFVYMQLKLMPGRSDAVKSQLATALLDCAKVELAAQLSSRVSVQLCVEVEELNASYQKQLLVADAG